MHRYARVVIESTLLQLDREFDFLVPEALQGSIAFGQRVKVAVGRSRKLHTGFVVELPAESLFATSELVEIVDETSVLTHDIYRLARQVADRQCVAIGEVLSLAIPDHMPRIGLEQTEVEYVEPVAIDAPKLDNPLGNRAAVLTSARSIALLEAQWPDWTLLFAFQALEQLKQGNSSILIVPEQDQVDLLRELLSSLGVDGVSSLGGKQKKAERYRSFRNILSQAKSIVVGTRAAVFAPVKNLGLIALFDDLDDSLRDQGSPFTHAREIALMRATESRLLLAANYRSVEVQRLVEIGYLTDHTIIAPPPRISFSPQGLRVDQSAFAAIKERVEEGPVLVLMPRKGSSAAAYCGGCGDRLTCPRCGGSIWEPEVGRYECRICKTGHIRCSVCKSNQAKPGRTGSSRTVAELGRAFPQVTMTEATAEKTPSRILKNRQLVIATPGSAPRTKDGYAALLILDPEVWLYSQSLRAEQIAIRDWQEAFELMSQTGRGLIVGVSNELGQAVSLQQHRELASKALRDLNRLSLPPAVRIARLEGSSETIASALEVCLMLGAIEIATDLGDQASTLIKFSYRDGPAIAQALRTLAIKTNARLVGTNKRRGLRIVMDDPTAL